MPVRHRYRDKHVAGAGYYSIGPLGGTPIATYNGAAGVTDHEDCFDFTNSRPYPDSPLTLVRNKVEPLRLYGNVPYSFFGTYYSQYHGWNPTNMTLYQYAPTLQDFDFGYWVTKALANLNPNKPLVDLPLFLFEFREIPKGLKELGEILSRKIKPTSAHDAYLASTYGWEPLYSDLKSLLNIGKSINDRVKYLTAIENGAHIRRNLGGGDVPHTLAVGAGTYGDDFRGTLITADVTTSETMKAWVTARVRLLNPLPPPSEVPAEALKLLLNLNVSKATLWNAIPWSFVIDYFAGISDYLEASRGYVPFEVTQMCVMVKQEATSHLTNVVLYPGCSYTGGRKTTTAKWRRVYAMPLATVAADPFLTGRQITNLGALLTAQGLRKFLRR